MKYKFDHDFHIHSYLSSCSGDPEQSAERILRYAKEVGLEKICVTDHYWDEKVEGASNWYKPQNFEHIKDILPLPKSDGIDFLFGTETEMARDYTLGIPKERFEDFDFVVIPTTHLHMKGFTIKEEECTYQGKAKAWIERLDALLNMDLPFHKIGIAHLACGTIAYPKDELIKVLDLVSDSEAERLFAKAADKKVGIELNKGDMSFTDSQADSVLRLFKIAKNCGCKFYCGTDAHFPRNFENARDIFERAINMLCLTENDKFHIKEN